MQYKVLKTSGLDTFPNELSELSEGALQIADNVVIDKEGVISPRRGFEFYGGSASAKLKQIWTYKTRLFRHYGSTVDFDSDGAGTFQTLDTNLLEPSQKMRAVEANGNLYFTSSTGVKKISASAASDLSTATITPAGGAKALDGSAVITTTLGAGGFFTQDSSVAYRMVWGTKDKNNNLILGTPSERVEISNSMLALLTADYNNLISLLSVARASGGTLNDTDYLNFTVSPNASASNLWTAMQNLCTKLDKDAGVTNAFQGVSQRIAVVQSVTASATTNLTVCPVHVQDRFGFLAPGDTVTIVGNNAVMSSGDINGDWPVVAVNTTATVKVVDYTAGSAVMTNIIGNPTGAQHLIPGMTVDNIDYPTGTVISSIAPDFSTITVSAPASTTRSAVSTTFGYCFEIIAPVAAVGAYTGFVYKKNVPARKHATKPTDPATTEMLMDLQAFFNDIVEALLELPSSVIGVQPSFTFATQSSNVTLTFSIPAAITASNYSNYFYQIYRSPQATSTGVSHYYDLTASDELQLCYEANPTLTDITNGFFTVTDVVPDSFLGANLYSNANSGEGAGQVNEVPPLAQDIALFKGSVFYANTQTKHNLFLNMLSATGLHNQTITIALPGATSNTYTFYNTANVVTVHVVAGSKFQQSNALGDYFTIVSANNVTSYKIWYKIGSSFGPSGANVFEVDVDSTTAASDVARRTADVLNSIGDFSAVASGNVITVTNSKPGASVNPSATMQPTAIGAGFSVSSSGLINPTNGVGIANYAPTPAQAVDLTSRNFARAINRNTSGNVNAYYISGPNDVPGALYLETRASGTAAFNVVVGSASLSNKFNPTLPTSGTSVVSTNDASPNRVYFSKFQQPESVPSGNYLNVGPKDKAIRRILPLRDALFVLSDSGVYRITGDAGVFTVSLLDGSALIKAPDTAATLNNSIYSFSNQGVMKITDTGVTVVSRKIEDQLIPLLTPAYTHFSDTSFAVGYESDRAFLLFTVKSPDDVHPTQVFRLNTFTNTWTRWPISKTCAVVPPTDDKLYVGDGDVGQVGRERKTFSRLDHADRANVLNLPFGAYDAGKLRMGLITGIHVGDVLVQTQNLTCAQFNRLLTRLDSLPQTRKNYTSLLKATPGCDLWPLLASLASALDSDSGLKKTNSVTSFSYISKITGTNTFSNHQAVFNAIVAALNSDIGVAGSHFLSSVGTVSYEAPVVSMDTTGRDVTIAYDLPLVSGPITQYVAIPCVVSYAPQHLGDPSVTKHIRESTFIMKETTFSQALAEFSSDLMPGYQAVAITGDGAGAFGESSFGTLPFGGSGSERALRVLIPRDKQRCRYALVQWRHAVALEQWDLYGFSLTFEVTSSRGYR